MDKRDQAPRRKTDLFIITEVVEVNLSSIRFRGDHIGCSLRKRVHEIASNARVQLGPDRVEESFDRPDPLAVLEKTLVWSSVSFAIRV